MAPESQQVEASDPRRRFGDSGEDLAVVFLMSRGFTILQRNWSCRLGEIDVIAEKEGVVHFVEVKTRRTRMFGNPEDSITRKKLLHMRRTIDVYLAQARIQPREYQMDALAILVLPGEKPEYHFIEQIG
ncbi:MAG: YraN family protein [Patescibacteria group bacterium]